MHVPWLRLLAMIRSGFVGNVTGPAKAKLDWSGLPTLVYANSQMRVLARRIRGCGGMSPREINFLKLDALRRLLRRPFWA